MNRRRVSKGLKADQVRELSDAWHHARRIGRPLNALITIRPMRIDELSPSARCMLFAGVRNKLGVYARQRRFKLFVVWTREANKDGAGEHLHVLMHVPAKWRSHLEDTVIRWFPDPAEADVRTANQVISVDASGVRRSVVGYVMKQMTPQAWFKRGVIRKAGGPVLGLRGGCTRNLAWNAREAWHRARDARRSALRTDARTRGTAHAA